jgi:spermidine/putrescine transport system substrate-binding protein
MKATLLGASALFLATGASASEVHVLNWKGYGADEPFATKAFEEMTGDRVVNDFFNSEQEMLTKLRTNPGLYDVVMINAAFMRQALDESLVQPIITSKIENYNDLNAEQASSTMLNKDDKTYGVPWTWGLTTIAVNDKAFDTLPTSLKEMWKEEHKGRVTIRDDAVEAIQLGALATGQNINDIKDMAAVEQSLSDLLPNVRTFWSSENDWNQMVASNQIDLGTYWSGSAGRAQAQFNLPVSLAVPEEGAVGWLDSFAIPVGSDNVEGAEKFINYMISPEFYSEWDQTVGAPVSASQRALAALPEDSFNRKVMGSPEIAARVQFQQPISDAQRESYLQTWQKLKVNAN